MSDIFGFIKDMGNYESCKVDRYEIDDTIIDTAKVLDGKQPFETAIAHPRYNHGEWVIVEAYNTVNEANKGHDKWVKTMTSEELLPSLKDCGNACISSLGSLFGMEMEFLIDNK